VSINEVDNASAADKLLKHCQPLRYSS